MNSRTRINFHEPNLSPKFKNQFLLNPTPPPPPPNPPETKPTKQNKKRKGKRGFPMVITFDLGPGWWSLTGTFFLGLRIVLLWRFYKFSANSYEICLVSVKPRNYLENYILGPYYHHFYFLILFFIIVRAWIQVNKEKDYWRLT